jgi:hypothetical protein
VSAVRPVLELHDLDQLLALARDGAVVAGLRRAGLSFDGLPLLERDRERLASTVDRRWLGWYERALGRYGRGVTLVRERVCQGCFVQLPTSAAPPQGEGHLHLCESCGRLLFWS